MKRVKLFKLAACIVLAVVTGCTKEQPAADTQSQGTKTTETIKTDAANAAATVKTEATQAVEAVKTEATKAVDSVKTTGPQAGDQAAAQLQATPSPAQQEAQGLIEKAKSLIGEQKYQEAMGSLNQLTKFQLTPDQQKLVDSLKEKIESALAKATTSDAASALGGALGGKQ